MKYKTTDDYLATLSDDKKQALQELRETIIAIVPEATEAFVYGVPGFKINGKALVCYAGFKNHCGFYPLSPEVIKQFAEDLDEYEKSKGTVKFLPEHPIPRTIVENMVLARVKEISSQV